MCDKTISESPKALAARIAELEKKLSVLSATGTVPQTQTSSFNNASSAKEDIPRSEAEELFVQPIAETQSERIPFPNISDVYEFLTDNPSLLSFLQKAKIYLQGDAVVIASDKFTIEMIKIESGESLNNSFISATGKSVNIIFEEQTIEETNINQVSFMDEL